MDDDTPKLADRIRALKRERNALILAHNYQRPEVQDVADYVGDSLGLSRTAAAAAEDVIVFCGVHFMAETAAALAPGKTVLNPEPLAGCPMANMCTPRELALLKARHPDARVVLYINSSAGAKALADVCCTSANAEKIVRSLPEDRPIIFAPDRNLGANVARATGRDMILWEGFCPTHERFRPAQVADARARWPGALIVVHPECPPAVAEGADVVASTTGILDECRASDAETFVIGTETGLLHRLRRENPGKRFVPLSETADCPDMKLVTLRKIVWALEDMAPATRLDPALAEAARRPIERMLALS